MIENRKYVIQFIFVLVGAIFLLKLFSLQILDPTYKLAAENNSMKRVTEYPYRGEIYDRNGKVIVYNAPVFDIMVTPREVVMEDTMAFCHVMNISKEVFIQKMKDAKEYSRRKPSAFLKQISGADFAKMQDLLMDYPGFSVVPRTVRAYPHTTLANSLGYIGEISDTKMKKLKEDGNSEYSPGDYIGITGLELQYEKYLRGKRGVKHILVNVSGVYKGSFKDGAYDTTAVKGDNLFSSIDLELQQYGDSLMQGKIGSAIAIEPKTGEILAIISGPSYDPNILTGREFSQNYRALERDKKKPLFNRALQSMYRPGSTFKLVQGLVALQQGVLTPRMTYPCSAPVKCHPHPGPANLHSAIQYSCNPYFYYNFRRMVNQDKSPNTFKDTQMGMHEWKEHMESFGFGKRLGVDIPNESRGLIPGVSYYDKIYGELRWKFSTIYSISIGEGEIGVNPIQMANFAAIIANKGWYYTPHFVKGVGDNKVKPEQFTIKHHTTVDSSHFIPVINGMESVVREGTARKAQSNNFVVCGKTGTSQNAKGKDHSIFIAFAPKDDPKIAIAVFVENAGFGGQVAAPIAGLMMEKYITRYIPKEKKGLEKYMMETSFIPDELQQR
jgi:penicillin-binding protein 2